MIMESEILSDDELAAITGYKARAYQRRWLSDRKWSYVESRGGRPLVGRHYARMKLGAISAGTTDPAPQKTRPVWTPDYSRVS